MASNRKKRVKPLDEAKRMIELDIDKDCCEKRFINHEVGYGVFATRDIVAGEFLLDYCGDVLTVEDALALEDQTYIYYCDMGSKSFAIDGTNNVRLGRFINDEPRKSVKCNCVVKTAVLQGKCHVLIFATKDVEVGSELRYDYNVPDLPWRKIATAVHSDMDRQETASSNYNDTDAVGNKAPIHSIHQAMHHQIASSDSNNGNTAKRINIVCDYEKSAPTISNQQQAMHDHVARGDIVEGGTRTNEASCRQSSGNDCIDGAKHEEETAKIRLTVISGENNTTIPSVFGEANTPHSGHSSYSSQSALPDYAMSVDNGQGETDMNSQIAFDMGETGTTIPGSETAMHNQTARSDIVEIIGVMATNEESSRQSSGDDCVDGAKREEETAKSRRTVISGENNTTIPSVFGEANTPHSGHSSQSALPDYAMSVDKGRGETDMTSQIAFDMRETGTTIPCSETAMHNQTARSDIGEIIGVMATNEESSRQSSGDDCVDGAKREEETAKSRRTVISGENNTTIPSVFGEANTPHSGHSSYSSQSALPDYAMSVDKGRGETDMTSQIAFDMGETGTTIPCSETAMHNQTARSDIVEIFGVMATNEESSRQSSGNDYVDGATCEEETAKIRRTVISGENNTTIPSVFCEANTPHSGHSSYSSQSALPDYAMSVDNGRVDTDMNSQIAFDMGETGTTIPGSKTAMHNQTARSDIVEIIGVMATNEESSRQSSGDDCVDGAKREEETAKSRRTVISGENNTTIPSVFCEANTPHSGHSSYSSQSALPDYAMSVGNGQGEIDMNSQIAFDIGDFGTTIPGSETAMHNQTARSDIVDIFEVMATNEESSRQSSGNDYVDGATCEEETAKSRRTVISGENNTTIPSVFGEANTPHSGHSSYSSQSALPDYAMSVDNGRVDTDMNSQIAFDMGETGTTIPGSKTAMHNQTARSDIVEIIGVMATNEESSRQSSGDDCVDGAKREEETAKSRRTVISGENNTTIPSVFGEANTPHSGHSSYSSQSALPDYAMSVGNGQGEIDMNSQIAFDIGDFGTTIPGSETAMHNQTARSDIVDIFEVMATNEESSRQSSGNDYVDGATCEEETAKSRRTVISGENNTTIPSVFCEANTPHSGHSSYSSQSALPDYAMSVDKGRGDTDMTSQIAFDMRETGTTIPCSETAMHNQTARSDIVEIIGVMATNEESSRQSSGDDCVDGAKREEETAKSRRTVISGENNTTIPSVFGEANTPHSGHSSYSSQSALPDYAMSVDNGRVDTDMNSQIAFDMGETGTTIPGSKTAMHNQTARSDIVEIIGVMATNEESSRQSSGDDCVDGAKREEETAKSRRTVISGENNTTIPSVFGEANTPHSGHSSYSSQSALPDYAMSVGNGQGEIDMNSQIAFDIGDFGTTIPGIETAMHNQTARSDIVDIFEVMATNEESSRQSSGNDYVDGATCEEETAKSRRTVISGENNTTIPSVFGEANTPHSGHSSHSSQSALPDYAMSVDKGRGDTDMTSQIAFDMRETGTTIPCSETAMHNQTARSDIVEIIGVMATNEESSRQSSGDDCVDGAKREEETAKSRRTVISGENNTTIPSVFGEANTPHSGHSSYSSQSALPDYAMSVDNGRVDTDMNSQIAFDMGETGTTIPGSKTAMHNQTARSDIVEIIGVMATNEESSRQSSGDDCVDGAKREEETAKSRRTVISGENNTTIPSVFGEANTPHSGHSSQSALPDYAMSVDKGRGETDMTSQIAFDMRETGTTIPCSETAMHNQTARSDIGEIIGVMATNEESSRQSSGDDCVDGAKREEETAKSRRTVISGENNTTIPSVFGEANTPHSGHSSYSSQSALPDYAMSVDKGRGETDMTSQIAFDMGETGTTIPCSETAMHNQTARSDIVEIFGVMATNEESSRQSSGNDYVDGATCEEETAKSRRTVISGENNTTIPSVFGEANTPHSGHSSYSSQSALPDYAMSVDNGRVDTDMNSQIAFDMGETGTTIPGSKTAMHNQTARSDIVEIIGVMATNEESSRQSSGDDCVDGAKREEETAKSRRTVISGENNTTIPSVFCEANTPHSGHSSYSSQSALPDYAMSVGNGQGEIDMNSQIAFDIGDFGTTIPGSETAMHNQTARSDIVDIFEVMATNEESSRQSSGNDYVDGATCEEETAKSRRTVISGENNTTIPSVFGEANTPHSGHSSYSSQSALPDYAMSVDNGRVDTDMNSQIAFDMGETGTTIPGSKTAMHNQTARSDIVEIIGVMATNEESSRQSSGDDCVDGAKREEETAKSRRTVISGENNTTIPSVFGEANTPHSGHSSYSSQSALPDYAMSVGNGQGEIDMNSQIAFDIGDFGTTIPGSETAMHNQTARSDIVDIFEVMATNEESSRQSSGNDYVDGATCEEETAKSRRTVISGENNTTIPSVFCEANTPHSGHSSYSSQSALPDYAMSVGNGQGEIDMNSQIAFDIGDFGTTIPGSETAMHNQTARSDIVDIFEVMATNEESSRQSSGNDYVDGATCEEETAKSRRTVISGENTTTTTTIPSVIGEANTPHSGHSSQSSQSALPDYAMSIDKGRGETDMTSQIAFDMRETGTTIPGSETAMHNQTARSDIVEIFGVMATNEESSRQSSGNDYVDGAKREEETAKSRRTVISGENNTTIPSVFGEANTPHSGHSSYSSQSALPDYAMSVGNGKGEIDMNSQIAFDIGDFGTTIPCSQTAMHNQTIRSDIVEIIGVMAINEESCRQSSDNDWFFDDEGEGETPSLTQCSLSIERKKPATSLMLSSPDLFSSDEDLSADMSCSSEFVIKDTRVENATSTGGQTSSEDRIATTSCVGEIKRLSKFLTEERKQNAIAFLMKFVPDVSSLDEDSGSNMSSRSFAADDEEKQPINVVSASEMSTSCHHEGEMDWVSIAVVDVSADTRSDSVISLQISSVPSPIKIVVQPDGSGSDNDDDNSNYVSVDDDDDDDDDDTVDQSVDTTSKKQRKKRDYSKVLACFFCKKLLKMKMQRHLETVHKDLAEIKAICNLPKEERSIEFTRLTNRGNFIYNVKVLESGEGTLIVGRRCGRDILASDYLPCTYCQVFFLSHDIYRHFKVCKFNPQEKKTNSNEPKATKRAVSLCRMLLDGAMKKKSAECSAKFNEEVLSKMRFGSLTTLVKNDSLIIKFGSSLHHRLGKLRRHDISQRMRQLARLVKAVNERSLDENPVDLLQCLTGPKFDEVLKATESLCSEFDDESGRHLFHNPSIGLKLGHSLIKCAEYKVGMALRGMDINMRAEAEAFIALHKSEWTDRISSPSLASLKQRKYNNPQLLPLTSDLVKLKAFQEKAMMTLTEDLLKYPEYSTWRKLLNVVYSRLLIYNKRRGGETAKLLLSSYINRPKWEEVANDALVKTLTPMEQQLLRRMDMVHLPGKGTGARRVPLLLQPQCVAAMDALVKHRHHCGIPDTNIYFFASVSASNFINGWQVLDQVATEAQLESPKLIHSTLLRKYMATVSQVVDLNQGELKWLANHMGHDINIHEAVYRLHDSTIELAKVSRLLMAVDNGVISDFAGKPLADINLEDFPPTLDESDSEGKNSGTSASTAVPKSKNCTARSSDAESPVDVIQKNRTVVHHSDVEEEHSAVCSSKSEISKKRIAVRSSENSIKKKRTAVHYSDDEVPEEPAVCSSNTEISKKRTAVRSSENSIKKKRTAVHYSDVEPSDDEVPEEPAVCSSKSEISKKRIAVRSSENSIKKKRTAVHYSDDEVPEEPAVCSSKAKTSKQRTVVRSSEVASSDDEVSLPKTVKSKGRKASVRFKWSEEDLDVLRKEWQKFLLNDELPLWSDVIKLVKKYPHMESRTKEQIKARFVYLKQSGH